MRVTQCRPHRCYALVTLIKHRVREPVIGPKRSNDGGGIELHAYFQPHAHQRSTNRFQSRNARPGCKPTAMTPATFLASSAFRGFCRRQGTVGCRTWESLLSASSGRRSGSSATALAIPVQFTENLTKIYRSHTFKGGFEAQEIYFRGLLRLTLGADSISTASSPLYQRTPTASTGRAQFLLTPTASSVPGWGE